jgi:transposase
LAHSQQTFPNLAAALLLPRNRVRAERGGHPVSAVVERTIAWLNRCRRLAKDWENLNRKALAFLRLASIRLMLRKLCNPA